MTNIEKQVTKGFGYLSIEGRRTLLGVCLDGDIPSTSIHHKNPSLIRSHPRFLFVKFQGSLYKSSIWWESKTANVW